MNPNSVLYQTIINSGAGVYDTPETQSYSGISDPVVVGPVQAEFDYSGITTFFIIGGFAVFAILSITRVWVDVLNKIR
ncbi:hypothetical protein A8L34_29575 [Bacillus sp. FJAT-27264]|uniref:hypothetical protein n=1 Tax=Paenibacillus sp. (strain DSM 101736 / FJAT-27264) TaxID=1850362 RepID=UPI000807B943|nr:hypothetical protein [Bacillus sp. FJAT-27264]OBZ15167.1 hypothetical protein A8L34_29575 [Bacillus sp. FJAT-27264]